MLLAREHLAHDEIGDVPDANAIDPLRLKPDRGKLLPELVRG
jgi:hypothetical protein